MVGDVVLTPFPFTDLTETKARPAIVLSGVGMSDWVVCLITSSGPARAGDIAISSLDLKQGELRRNSVIRPGRLITLNDVVFRRTVGRLTEAKLAEVLAAVRNLF